MKRRDFIKSTAAGCCGAIIGGSMLEKALGNNSFDNNLNEEALKTFLSFTDQDFKKLAETSISTANRNGASYSDIRICKNRNQSISTRGRKDTKHFRQ